MSSLSQIAIEFYDKLLTYEPARVREVIASPTPELCDAFAGLLKAMLPRDADADEAAAASSEPDSAVADKDLYELNELPEEAAAYGKLVNVLTCRQDCVYQALYVFQHSICGVERAEPHQWKCAFVSAIEISCAGYTNNAVFVHHASNSTLLVLYFEGTKLCRNQVIQTDAKYRILALSGYAVDSEDTSTMSALVHRIGWQTFREQTFRAEAPGRYVIGPMAHMFETPDSYVGTNFLAAHGLREARPMDIRIINDGKTIIFKGQAPNLLCTAVPEPAAIFYARRNIYGVYAFVDGNIWRETQDNKIQNFAVRKDCLIVQPKAGRFQRLRFIL
jgi:hypothetical protein